MGLYEPEAAPEEVRRETAAPAQPALAAPVRNRTGLYIGAALGFAVLGLALVVVAVYFYAVLGPSMTFVGALLAMIPLAIVLAGVVWVDRWEPEPRTALLFAFLWGATIAVLVALFVDSGIQGWLNARGADESAQYFFSAVIQAPLVEEVGKGLGVLLIALVARHLVDGPVDGIVYAAVVGAGFAFTENIQYFGLELSGYYGEQSDIVSVFFVRGILSPFAHVLFSACVGFAIGLTVRRGSRWLTFLVFLVGLIPAIALHAFWNGSTLVSDFFLLYLLIQVPLFAAAIGFVVYLQQQEARITRDRLSEYADAGWLSPAEVPSLATFTGRRQALAWARQHGVADEMKNYIRDATQLAYSRQRMLTGRDITGNQADEAVYLVRVSRSRSRLMAAQPTP